MNGLKQLLVDILEEELSNIGFECKRYNFSEKGTPDVDNLFAKFGSEEPHFHNYMRNILVNNWKNHSGTEINYGGFSL